MHDHNHKYYIFHSFSEELRPPNPPGSQNVGTRIAFQGREMTYKTYEVLLHMQTLSNKMKLFTYYQVSYKSVAIFSDVFEVHKASLFGYTLNCHII